MQYKKHMKRTGGLVVAGVGLGLGSQLLGEAGSSYGQAAVGKVSKVMPMMGTMVGAGMVMDAVGDMSEYSKKMMKKKKGGH